MIAFRPLAKQQEELAKQQEELAKKQQNLKKLKQQEFYRYQLVFLI
jgi:hypothetical protein